MANRIKVKKETKPSETQKKKTITPIQQNPIKKKKKKAKRTKKALINVPNEKLERFCKALQITPKLDEDPNFSKKNNNKETAKDAVFSSDSVIVCDSDSDYEVEKSEVIAIEDSLSESTVAANLDKSIQSRSNDSEDIIVLDDSHAEETDLEITQANKRLRLDETKPKLEKATTPNSIVVVVSNILPKTEDEKIEIIDSDTEDCPKQDIANPSTNQKATHASSDNQNYPSVVANLPSIPVFAAPSSVGAAAPRHERPIIPGMCDYIPLQISPAERGLMPYSEGNARICPPGTENSRSQSFGNIRVTVRGSDRLYHRGRGNATTVTKQITSYTSTTSTLRTGPFPEVTAGSLFGDNLYNAGQVRRTGLRDIIIDGSNVAIGHSHGRFFSVKGLKICIDYFLRRGHRVKAFVPHYRVKNGQSSDPVLLQKLHSRNQVVLTPSREINGRQVTCYDDRLLVQCAAELEAVVVSGDNYRDLLQENPRLRETIEQRLLIPTWVDDMIIFPSDPLGRHGPCLDEFLRFP